MTGGGGGRIVFSDAPYMGGQFADAPAPPGSPDGPHSPGGALDAMYNAVVGIANSDDPMNDLEGSSEQSDRADQYGDALSKFPANDEQSQMLMQMSQVVPQAMTGIMGGLTGMLGGLAAIPAALAQAGTQVMQTGMGALTSATSAAGEDDDEEDDEDAGYDSVEGGGGFGGGEEGGGGDGAGEEGTTLPATYLAPPQLPAAATFPAAAAPAFTPAPAAQPAAQAGAGMPMMPMAPGMGGAGAAGDKNAAVTKKVQPPTIANSRPVLGRFVADRLDAPVVKRVTLKPKNAATGGQEGTRKT